MKKILAKLGELIKSKDLFGVPVQLTYKGQSSFNTLCGGCVSILIIVSLVPYFVVELDQAYRFPDYKQSPAR